LVLFLHFHSHLIVESFLQKEQTVLHSSFVPNEDWLMFFISEIQSTKQFQEFLTNQKFNVNSRFLWAQVHGKLMKFVLEQNGVQSGLEIG
jgi:hypothetical protein